MSDETTAQQSYDAPPTESTAGLSIAVLGLGRAGQALAREFVDAGCSVVGLWNRGPKEVHPDLAELPIHRGGQAPPQSLIDAANVLVLAVHDSVIEEVAARLAPRPGTLLLHLSGALPASALGPLPPSVHGGCYHPLQSFRSDGEPAWPVPPYYLALDGDARALAVGRSLANATGHPCLVLDPEGKAAYHAAAVLTSGCMVALQSAATEALSASGVPENQRWPLLWPLAAGTMANLGDGDFPGSLTGPIARGDAETTARNLAALAELPEVAALYRALGLRSLEQAVKGGLESERAAATRAVLEDT